MSISQKTRMLIDELQTVQTTMKLGSVEREQREDEIYRQLYDIAEHIKTDGSLAKKPEMKDIYARITGDTIVSRFPVYTDEYKMFVQHPEDPKTRLFLEKISGNTEQPTDEILRSFVSKCGRKGLLEHSRRDTCTSCWSGIMRQIFRRMIQILTVELKRRSEQIKAMTEAGILTEVDMKDLVKHIESILHKTSKLVTRSEKHIKSKEEWIELNETLFQFMVDIVNDLMMRYVEYIRVKKQIKI